MTKIFILSVVTLLLAGNVSAQENTLLPDNPFYPLKMVIEGIEGFFKSFGTKEAQITHVLTLAEIRLKEAKLLSDKGKPILARETIRRYEILVTDAELNVIQIQDEPKKAQLIELIFDKKRVFASQLDQIPEDAKPDDFSIDPDRPPEQASLISVARIKYGLFLNQARNQCLSAGGEWMAEADWVGCVGVGLKDCSRHFLFAEAVDLCHRLDGKVNCSPEGVYCKR